MFAYLYIFRNKDQCIIYVTTQVFDNKECYYRKGWKSVVCGLWYNAHNFPLG